MAKFFEGPFIWVLLLLVVLLWGGPKLPGLAKSLGESMRIFRKEMKSMNEESEADKKAKGKDETPSDK